MRPMVIAHRGASHLAPENTLAAFRAAAQLGVDGIETDVQLTKDGRMVMHHNYTIDANSNGSGAILSMTEQELRQYDFGSWKGPEFAGERIPTLAECLEVCRGFSVVNIELKAPMDRTIPYVEPVAQAIRQSGYMSKIIVSAFDHSLLRQLKALEPELRVGALTLPPMDGSPIMELAAKCLPADKPLDQIKPEEVTAPPPEAADALKGMNIRGKDPMHVVMEQLQSTAAIFPGMTLAQVSAALAAQKDLAAYVAGLDFKLDYLHCEYHSCLADPALIGKMHAMGVGVNPWTVDGEEELRAILAMEPDGIITNRPDRLLAML